MARGMRTDVDSRTDERFRQGCLHTGFIEEFFARRVAETPDAEESERMAVAALVAALHSTGAKPAATAAGTPVSKWLLAGRAREMR